MALVKHLLIAFFLVITVGCGKAKSGDIPESLVGFSGTHGRSTPGVVQVGADGTAQINAPGFYTVCGRAGKKSTVVLAADFVGSAKAVLSIYVASPDTEVVMENPGKALPASLWLAAAGDLILTSLNVDGDIDIGGLAPGHSVVACP